MAIQKEDVHADAITHATHADVVSLGRNVVLEPHKAKEWTQGIDELSRQSRAGGVKVTPRTDERLGQKVRTTHNAPSL